MTCPLELQPGDALELAFFGVDMDAMIQVSGEVRRRDGHGFGIGFQKLPFDTREQIGNLIYHVYLDESKQPLTFHPQRKEPRVPLRLPVTLRGQDLLEQAFEEETYTENVSRNGACLVTHRYLEVGSTVELEAAGQFRAQAAVRVRWANRQQKDRFVVGVQFLKVEGQWIVR